MVCRNCSASCSPLAPPSAISIGHAGCSGNWASPTAPSHVTGSCCCPGNAYPPITTGVWRCCCSGGSSKPAEPSVEKLEKLRNYFLSESKRDRKIVPWEVSCSRGEEMMNTADRPTCLQANFQSLQTIVKNVLTGRRFSWQEILTIVNPNCSLLFAKYFSLD